MHSMCVSLTDGAHWGPHPLGDRGWTGKPVGRCRVEGTQPGTGCVPRLWPWLFGRPWTISTLQCPHVSPLQGMEAETHAFTSCRFSDFFSL